MENGKECKQCKEFKSWSEFAPVDGNRDGFNTRCKECVKENVKDYQKEYRNRPEVKAKLKEYAKQYRNRPEYKAKIKLDGEAKRRKAMGLDEPTETQEDSNNEE